MGTIRITITSRCRAIPEPTIEPFPFDAGNGGCAIKIARLVAMIALLAAVATFVMESCQSMAQSNAVVKVAEQQTAQVQIRETEQTKRAYIQETEQTKRTKIVADKDMHISDNGVQIVMITEVWSKLALGAVASILIVIVAALVLAIAKIGFWM